MNFKKVGQLKNILIALIFASQIMIGQNKSNDLSEALENGKHIQVVTLINEGAALNNSEELLYKATLNSNIEHVKQNYNLLLKSGYKQDEYEYLTAFYSAIVSNNTEVISFLATQPEWNIKNDYKNNQTEIFQRAYTELKENPLTEPSALKTLIDLGIDLKSYRTEQYVFKFAKDCYKGYKEKEAITAFKKLASMGINLNNTQPNGETILHQAARNASDSIYHIFKKLDVDISIRNVNGKTADDIFLTKKIIKSIRLEEVTTLDSLLAQVVDINNEEYLNLVVDNASKKTVLKKFQTVLKHGYIPNNDISRQGDIELEHCLRVAINSNAIDLMKYIFTLDESLLQKDKLNHFYASAIYALNTFPKKNESAIQLLVDNGLDIHSIKNKKTLLELAKFIIGDDGQKTFKYFISLYPVDLNFQDEDGFTILHYAAQNGNQEQFTFFENLGVDTSIKSNNGKTANESLKSVLNGRKAEALLLGSTPYILFLLSSTSLVLSIVFRKKINNVLARIAVSFIDALSFFYIFSTVFIILQDGKESALEIMILFSVFGAVVVFPVFFTIQYLIFRLLKSKKHSGTF